VRVRFQTSKKKENGGFVPAVVFPVHGASESEVMEVVLTADELELLGEAGLLMDADADDRKALQFKRKMFRTEDEFQQFHAAIKGVESEKDKQLVFLNQQLLPADRIVFKGKKFMFTETFNLGPRKECGRLVELAGGIFSASKRPQLDLDYLVLGEKTTEWKTGHFWGKIEAGLLLVERGVRLQFVAESEFVKAVKIKVG